MVGKIQIISNLILIASEVFVVIFAAKIFIKVKKTENRVDKFDKIVDECMGKIDKIEKEWKMKT